MANFFLKLRRSQAAQKLPFETGSSEYKAENKESQKWPGADAKAPKFDLGKASVSQIKQTANFQSSDASDDIGIIPIDGQTNGKRPLLEVTELGIETDERDRSGVNHSAASSCNQGEVPKFRGPPPDITSPAPLAEREASLSGLWEAFTPTKPKNLIRQFAGRRRLIQRVIAAIEEEQANVVLYGPRGVGKTSLANVISQAAMEAGYQILRCPCSTDVTFEEIFRWFLRSLPADFMDRSARVSGSRMDDFGVENFEQLLPSGQIGPTEITQALSHLKLEHVIFVIDEFDRAESVELKLRLAETIKNLSDISARVTFVIVGIASSLEDLIGTHLSIQRHLVGVRVPLMMRSELHALVSLGETLSGMNFDQITRDIIVSISKGLPYYTQMLCLYAGKFALEHGSLTVHQRHLRKALEQILNDVDPALSGAYERATTGEQNKFTMAVLFSAASCASDRFGAFAPQAVIKAFARDDEKSETGQLSIYKALKALTLTKNGGVLESAHSPAGQIKYAFVNPAMRQYVLLRRAKLYDLI